MLPHRWSGAWCLDCGTEDPSEIALADGRYTEIIDDCGNTIRFHFDHDPSLDECSALDASVPGL